MICPYCGNDTSRVVDTREVGDAIRRRRECLKCLERFTTYERIAKSTLMVVKRDGRREPFDRQKLFEGIRLACTKLPIPTQAIEDLVSDVEASLYRMGRSEVPSKVIGELAIERLRQLDPLAYVRFASVYRSFPDLETLKQVVDDLLERKDEP
ncbi:MAG: transcriptional regulator NrdR [Anaerolineales bacterium]